MGNVTDDIITQASRGDMEAFEKIYRAFSGFVYTLAYGVTRNREAAEEVTQDVFLKVNRNLKYFKFQSSFKTWIYRIAVNTALNEYSRRKRSETRNVALEDEMNEIPVMATQRKALEQKDREELLARLMKGLTPEQRVCVLLREIKGFRYDEIAVALRINLNTVRSYIKRGREKLMAAGSKTGDAYAMR